MARKNGKFFYLFFFFLLLFPCKAFSIEETIRKIWAHILIHDYDKAYIEAKDCYARNPESQLAFESYLHCVAICEDERQWYKEWQKFKVLYPDSAYDVKLLEKVSWEILEKAKKSSNGQVRQIGLIAAALTRDVRSIPLIVEGLRDSNVSIRELSVELCALYGDTPLKEALSAAYEQEKIRKIRAAMISAFGKLHMQEMVGPLLLYLENDKVSTEEQVAIINMIVQLMQSISYEDVKRLVGSERSGLRILATEIIAKFPIENKEMILLTLLQDANPMVSAYAMKALGLLRIESLRGQPVTELISSYLQSPIASVAITASWLIKLHGDQRGDRILTYWIKEGDEETKALAASAISALGSYGVVLASQLLQDVKDSFTRLNLALALLGQREQVSLACQVCDEVLLQNHDRWMADSLLGGLFSPLKKSTLTHQKGITHYPEMMSQVLQLQVLSLLASVEYEGAKERIKDFLKTKHWRITGVAAELLLEESGEEALPYVQALLNNEDPAVALEAAIALAVWGRDRAAIPYLLAGYKGASLETKVKILESLSRIKDKTTIPFLVECFAEPSFLLRIITASILLQTLNN